eukprot:NODE_5603_length_1753_cov_7.732472.p1 GENE.NODE_5603_length_1753_cov_7.732472~~NODE_5603_length_1753_cov_7.732472.p1  ORF type:complete len:461 (-),score=77.70 NODE_5603_length_1753_cov_7.732472:273-1655(-)
MAGAEEVEHLPFVRGSSSFTGPLSLTQSQTENRDDDEPDGLQDTEDTRWRPRINSEFAFALVLILVFTSSGGIILGVGPFVHRLQTGGLVAESDTQVVFDGAFQIMTAMTIIWSTQLANWGPRATAVAGAIMATAGNAIVSMSTGGRIMAPNTRVVGLVVGYGLIGAGGNGIYLSSFQFANLFPTAKGFRCSCASASFAAAGWVYMLLSIESLELSTFFGAYAVYAGLLVVPIMLGFPGEAYADGAAARLTLPRLKDCRCQVFTIGSLKACMPGLRKPYFIAFTFMFAWSTCVLVWILGALSNVHKNEPSYYINVAFPIITNSTFVFGPALGRLMDTRGFVIPSIFLILSTQLALLTLLSDNHVVAWFSLLLCCMISAAAYTMQFAYVTLMFPPAMFPGLLCAVVVAQWAFGFIALYLASAKPFGEDWVNYVVLLFIPTILQYIFPVIQSRRERAPEGCM